VRKINPVIIILGLIDVFASLSLIFKIELLYFLGFLLIGKGLWTLITSLTYRSFFFFFIALLDLICGIMLVFNLSYPFLKLFPYILLVKGIYSIIFSM